ncbi:MAG: acyl-CoA dehydratase activase [Thermoplasmatota archaeon]
MDWDEAVGALGRGERIGVDIGSRSTKFCVDLENGIGIMDTPDLIFRDLWRDIPEGADIVTTGYGRDKVPKGRKIPEIRAHTVGVLRTLDLDDFTLLDIGGQDFKVVRVENRGIKDFHMNDKCAAGTGRFLEKMSDMLGMDLEEIGSIRGDSRILESTCSVFTETELISMMMEGASKEQMAGGVIYSIYERVRPYLRMFPSDDIVFTGGVSKCGGLREILEMKLKVKVTVPDNSQYMGALGCFHAL